MASFSSRSASLLDKRYLVLALINDDRVWRWNESWSETSFRNDTIVLHNETSTKHITESALIQQNDVHIKYQKSLEIQLSQMIAISNHPYQVNLTIDPLADIRPGNPCLISCNPKINCCRFFRYKQCLLIKYSNIFLRPSLPGNDVSGKTSVTQRLFHPLVSILALSRTKMRKSR